MRIDRGDLARRVGRVAARFPRILAVYLLGSAAAGRARRGSDIDLAVVPAGPGLRERRLDLLAELAREGLDEVDVAILDTDDLVLRYEAVRPNCLLYARPEFDHGSFFSRTVREYFDFLPYLERQRAALRRRLTGVET